MLYDRLGGWDREGGREGDAGGRRYGNVCIYVADSLCYKAETNNNNKKFEVLAFCYPGGVFERHLKSWN